MSLSTSGHWHRQPSHRLVPSARPGHFLIAPVGHPTPSLPAGRSVPRLRRLPWSVEDLEEARRSVDRLAPGPVLGAGFKWLEAHSRKELDSHQFALWAFKGVQECLAKPQRHRRTLIRIIKSRTFGRESATPGSFYDRPSDVGVAWPEMEQDAFAFFEWHRNRQFREHGLPAGLRESESLRLSASVVQGLQSWTLPAWSVRATAAIGGTAIWVERRTQDRLATDRIWICNVLGTSPREAQALALRNRGCPPTTVAALMGVADSTADEFLERGWRKVRRGAGMRSDEGVKVFHARTKVVRRLGGTLANPSAEPLYEWIARTGCAVGARIHDLSPSVAPINMEAV